jgi:hypothetical protein
LQGGAIYNSFSAFAAFASGCGTKIVEVGEAFMRHNPNHLSDIRRGIGDRLRDESILTEPLPDRLCELLAKLDRTDVPASGIGDDGRNEIPEKVEPLNNHKTAQS